ncbi:hypothetical protein L2E82_27068 [Cichorium intybus]|uniref:Uncharacterized protein n=1 Tax=Cichorium intybus TaxID=13427 RepID=A0ACB9CSB9_CICIN|nr:hypothetical protein L2E82_27068 [Cichorium intybus]
MSKITLTYIGILRRIFVILSTKNDRTGLASKVIESHVHYNKRIYIKFVISTVSLDIFVILSTKNDICKYQYYKKNDSG